MRIDRLEMFKVPPRWLFLKIETDEGYVGWGEPIVEGRAETVRSAVNELADLLIGKDPRRIEDLWQAMYRGGFYRGGPVLMSAISGVEEALWDIKAKALGVPIFELLGGAVRDKIRVYSHVGGSPEAAVRAARERVEAGFTALKMALPEKMQRIETPAAVDRALAAVAAVREAVGLEIDIGVDFHGRASKTMAKILAKELEPLRPMFIEEPVLSEQNDALKEIARHTHIPIATGERMYGRWGFKDLLAEGCADIIQPDVSHAGGILETKKIAAMAEAYDVALAPHCPLGPIALAACLQVDACTPNFVIQEQSLGIHYNQTGELLDYLVDPAIFRYERGYVALPAAPGLGIQIDEARVRERAQVGHNWRNPLWRHADGTVAEW